MDSIKVTIPAGDDGEKHDPTQKVTIPVSVVAWRDLKVHCAREKIKLTETAGGIVKEWVDNNVAV